MTRYRLPYIVLFFLLLVLFVGCETNKKTITQSEDNRGVGEAYMSKGDYSEALRYLLLAEQQYSKDFLLHDDLGKIYVAKGKYELAIDHFKKCIELNPEYAPGKNNLGSAYLLAGKWDEAIVIFKALNEDLMYATPHFPLYNLGWAYYNKKEYQTAIDYYNQALKSQYGFILALRGLGLVYKDMGQPEQALVYFHKATEKSPKFPQLYMDLGEVYTTLKKYDEAIGYYTEVSRIQPDSAISDQAKARITELMKLISQ